jgi:hypothetical protein
LEKYREYLGIIYSNESFDYELLEVIPGGIRYRDREARHIILQRVLGCMLILILRIALRWYKRRVIY